MKKYLVDYQLEDQEPEHDVISGKNENDAIKNLKKKIVKDLDFQNKEDIEWVETLQVLEIKEV